MEYRKLGNVLALTSFLLLFCKRNEAKMESPKAEAVFVALKHILLSLDGCEILYLHGSSALDPISLFDFDIIELSEPSSGARTLQLFASNVTYHRHEDIHRHTQRHCATGILFFNEFDPPNYQPWLFDTIIPRYGPIIRKDEDQFIFITPTPSVTDVALLSPKFGEKIKFKIALNAWESNDPNKVDCKTVDFYANDGDPVIKILRTFDIPSLGQSKTSLDASNLFPDMTKVFNGKMFRFTVPNVKYRFEMEWRDGAFHPKRGFYKWWLDEAIKKFNFTYHMFWSSFGKATGKPLDNGTFVGAAGDLLYDRADIAVIVGETYSRQPFFGFSAVLSYEWFFFITHTPRNFYSPKAIFWPFSPLMWGLFLITLIAMTFSLKLITEAGTDPVAKTKNWTYARMFDYIFTTFMEQDRNGPAESHSIRMLCTFWLLYSLVISNAYRGKLVTLIAFPIDTWIPTTFEELAHSNFKVALNTVGKVGAAYDMLSSSTNPIFQTLFHKIETVPQPEICLMRAMEEDLGCIMWEGIAQYAGARNVSDRFGYAPMVQSKEIALFIRDGFTYERRAIFKHHMDRTIEAALQMGLTIKWLQLDKEYIRDKRTAWEASVNKTEVIYDRDDGPKKLVLSQFTGLFILFLGGLILASVRFMIEIYYLKKRDKVSESKVYTSSDCEKDKCIMIKVECPPPKKEPVPRELVSQRKKSAPVIPDPAVKQNEARRVDNVNNTDKKDANNN